MKTSAMKFRGVMSYIIESTRDNFLKLSKMKLSLKNPTEILKDSVVWTVLWKSKKSLKNGNYSSYLLSKREHSFPELLERAK